MRVDILLVFALTAGIMFVLIDGNDLNSVLGGPDLASRLLGVSLHAPVEKAAD